jgi:hypothetical protein
MLANYCLPGADPDLQEPLAGRLLKVLDHFGGAVMILSGRRSTAQQWVLYNRRQEYLKNPEKWIAEHPGQSIPAHAAYPGTSKHEDGDAADLDKDDDVTWGAVHYTGHAYGVHFPIPDEDWHAEAMPDWVDPTPVLPEIPDMTKEEFAAAIGAEIPGPGQPFEGLVCVPLINNTFDGSDLYPLASAVSWIHDSQKRTLHGR